ncbi:hypothetical protein DSO57_1006920 [Entomophthora muscae]|uniref:Uncharacterized protein n=1 Tax=Entomophthora muscae TaxID=34485 RepID=A0ACC2U5V9_9FUNG|nr:hypothetical protein DSO57_1006920 [Entomophthora muscae]
MKRDSSSMMMVNMPQSVSSALQQSRICTTSSSARPGLQMAFSPPAQSSLASFGISMGRGRKKKSISQEEDASILTKKKPESLPYHKYLVVDFEQAQANSFICVFKSSPQGCYFHFRQALCCHLQKCFDHELVYTEGTKEAKDVFNCFAALALVQKEETNAFYDALLCHPYIQANQAVRIDNSSFLETRARKQGLNPKPGFLWAAGPVNCRTACMRFSGIKPPQADTKCIDPCGKKRQTKEIIAPNGGLITAPNRGTNLATISFMNLKSTPATNQEQTQERGMGPRPSPMTLTPEQDNQAAKSRFLTNGRTPRPGAILPPLDPSTQFPQPWPSQCLDGPPMENVKFGGGTI